MQTATIILDGKECEVNELKARKLASWLKQVEQPFAEAVLVITSAMDTDTDDSEQLSKVIAEVAEILGGSIDVVLNLLIAFAPELKDQIEEAYTSEIIPAIVEVIRLALPFDQADLATIWEKIQALG